MLNATMCARLFSPQPSNRFAVGFLLFSMVIAVGGCSREPGEPASAQQAWRQAAGELNPERLNVILITIDTLRADRLSVYGSDRVSTPNIDKLSSEGVRFSNASTTVPFTLPAHSSIMTGTYPPYHGVRENVGYTLDESLTTLAQELSRSGWSTAGFVSAFVLDSRWGIGRGFETYFDDFDLGASGTSNLGSVQRGGDETIAAALEWLDTEPSKPFFLWLHLYDPHDPYTPPEPFRSAYRHPYDGEVAYTDSLIGQFRSGLEERGLLEHSLLVLTGDHGEGLGQHKERFHGFFLYDSTVHVPLIIRTPFKEFAGQVVDAAVSHVDLLPTILEATGQVLPDQAQGSSLLPLMLEMEPESAPERVAYSESLYPLLHYGWAPLYSLRSSRFKFIDAPKPELYDLLDDPSEQENALLEERRKSRELKDALDALVEIIEVGGVSANNADLDEDTRRQLQALGYVAGRGNVESEEVADRDRADPKDRIRLHQLVMAAQSDISAEDFDTAEAKLREALATDDTLLDAHQMLGTISLQRQDFEQATENFRTALALNDDHSSSILGLATAYNALGLEDEALVGYQRVLDLDPTNSSAVLGATGILISRKLEDEAIDLLEEAVLGNRPPPILFNKLGELIVARGDIPRAKELFQTAIEGNDELAPAHFNLAVLSEEEGRPEEAMALYERTIELAPDHYQALFNLGRLVGQRQQFERQQDLYRQAIAANPEFFRGYYFLAKLLMDLGLGLDEAEALTRKALELDLDHRAGPLGYFVLADILSRQGKEAEAQRAAQRGREIQAEGS